MAETKSDLILEFTAYGHPEPQGSARMVPVKGYERPFITSDNPALKKWRFNVAWQAREAMRAQYGPNVIPRHVAVKLILEFVFKRPISAKDRTYPMVRPDVDKLARGVFDALSGIAYADDAQVVSADISKSYGELECAKIAIIAAQAKVAKA